MSIKFVTRFIDSPAGGLGRYERDLVRGLAAHQPFEQVEAKPWPLPELVIKTLELTGLDMRTVIQRNRTFVPGPRDKGIYHLSNQELATSLAFQRYKSPVVVTVHDIIPIVESKLGTVGGSGSTFQRSLVKTWARGLKRADHLIAVSAWTRNDLIQHLDIDPGRITTIYQGIDSQLFNPSPVPPPIEFHKWNLKRDGPYVLYVGSLHPRREVHTLIKAFLEVKRTIPALKLVLAGSSRMPAGEMFGQSTRERDLGPHNADSIVNTGTISDRTLVALYQHANVTVVPSRYEGFGYPIVEAMACGSPVIVSDATCLPEVVGDRGAGLIFPVGDHCALAKQLVNVLSNDELALRLKSSGFERAKEFTLDRRLQETLAVYQLVTQK